MSVRAMAAVIDHSATEGSTYTVALMLADHANADGFCWPTIDRLAWRSRVSESTAKRALRELVAIGEIVRVFRPGTSNVYQLTLPGCGQPGDRGGQSDTPRGVTGDPMGGSRQAQQGGVNGDPLTVKNHKRTAPANDDKGVVGATPMPPPDPDVVAHVAEIRDRIKRGPDATR